MPINNFKGNLPNIDYRYLNERINHLENQNKYALEALETVSRLGEFKESFSKIPDINIILKEIATCCYKTIRLKGAYIFLINTDNDFVLKYKEEPEESLDAHKELDELIESRKLAQYMYYKMALRHYSSTGQELIVHIISTSSRVRGLFIGILSDKFKTIPDYTLSILKILLLSGANCIENFELYQMLQEKITKLEESEKQLSVQAFYDTLTQLPNRFLLTQRLRDALKRNSRRSRINFALLMVDLDNFKRINDSMGHQTGDNLLVKFGERIKALLREYDTVSRLGGDEFIILLENIESHAQTIKVVKRICKEIERPFILDNQEIYISASTGVVMNTKWQENEEDIIRNADVAMYKAKKSKKGHYKVFTQRMYEQAIENMQLEIELKKALENAEFELFYQPILSCDASKIYGVEALLRWKHASAAHIPPNKFIPIAEETGLIVPLGNWVLHRALEQIKIFISQPESVTIP